MAFSRLGEILEVGRSEQSIYNGQMLQATRGMTAVAARLREESGWRFDFVCTTT